MGEAEFSRRRIDIVFAIPSLSGGGAEKVVITLLRHLNRGRFSVTLLLMNRNGKYFQHVPDDIDVKILEASKARYFILKVILYLRKNKADIVFSTLDYMNLLLAAARILIPSQTKVLIRETNTLSSSIEFTKWPRLSKVLYSTFYRNVDLIICQAQYMQADLISNFSIKESKTVVIYNPVDVKTVRELSSQCASAPVYNSNDVTLLAVGRLTYQKGFDLLLRALSVLPERFKLLVCGEGVLLNDLERLARELHIEGRVHFLGFQSNPYRYMPNSKFLVLSSRYEGLPNVVLEAFAVGLPVIAFNSPGGTAELISHENGILVNQIDPSSFAQAIIKGATMAFDVDQIRRTTFEKFDVVKILGMYESVFEKVAKR